MLALVPLFIIWEIIEVPAILFLGLWFLMQFFYGVGSMAAKAGVETGGVAFWAHIAGFLVGMAGVLVLRKPSRNPLAQRGYLAGFEICAETLASSIASRSNSSSYWPAGMSPFFAFSCSISASSVVRRFSSAARAALPELDAGSGSRNVVFASTPSVPWSRLLLSRHRHRYRR